MENLFKLKIRCRNKRNVKSDKPALVNSNASTLTMSESRIVGRRSTIVGDCNRIDGYKNRCLGSRNEVIGLHGIVIGDNNLVTGDFMVVRGDRNLVTGNNCSVIGDFNIVEGKNCTATGFHNRLNDAYMHETQLPTDCEDEKAEDGDATCIICTDNKALCMLLPCGHMKLCLTCVKELLKQESPLCPDCRAEIISVHRVYT